ncbi:T-complex 10 C-terminal domain-containing protein [Streptomyces massasporeus]
MLWARIAGPRADPYVNGDPHARGSGTRVRVAVAGEVEIRFPDGTRVRMP